MNPSVGVSHAKIILVGEHAVVYHQPAIALPLPRLKTIATLTKADHDQTIDTFFYDGFLNETSRDLLGLRTLIDTILTDFDQPDFPFNLKIQSEIPMERGLGSSAAAAVAVIRAFYSFFDQELSHERLLELAGISEAVIHGQPSGLDAATVSSNQPLLFENGKVVRELELNLHGFLIIADTGIEGQTGKAVAAVAQQLEHEPDETEHAIEHIGQIVRETINALKSNQIRVVGDLLNQDQTELKKLQVSDYSLDFLIQIANSNGSLGSKLTGGGRGGCMIALAETEEKAIKIKQALLQSGANRCWIQPLFSEKKS